MKSQIVGFFNTNYGSGISVELEYYDNDGKVVETSDDAVLHRYTVSLLKRIESFSFSTATFISGGTSASIVVTPPSEVQLSGAPIQGSYIITCTDESGINHSTDDISYNTGAATIQQRIIKSIPFLADKIEVISVDAYSYDVNGIKFMVDYRDYYADP